MLQNGLRNRPWWEDNPKFKVSLDPQRIPVSKHVKGDASCPWPLYMGVLTRLVQQMAAKALAGRICPRSGFLLVGHCRDRADPSEKALVPGQQNYLHSRDMGRYLKWQSACLVYKKHWVPYPGTRTVEAGGLESQGHSFKTLLSYTRPCPKMVVRCLKQDTCAQPPYCC